MLDLVDESLEAFLRATVPLSARDVDVSFLPPEREWSAKLTRPTVNIFLWDIRRSAGRSRSGMETIQIDGRTVHRMALPHIELRYLLTAWTTDHTDERLLLAGILRSVLAHGAVPEEYVAEALRPLGPLPVVMPVTGEQHVEVFRTLEGQLKPGVNVIVHAIVDTGVVLPAGPPTTGLELSSVNTRTGETSPVRRRVAGEVHDPGAVGLLVHSPRGAARVNAAGRFLVPGEAGDEIVLETVPPRSVLVPPVGGVVFEAS
jgi:Pvc16 N-terminal domain